MNKPLLIISIAVLLAACVSGPKTETKTESLQNAEHLQSLGVSKFKDASYQQAQAYFDKALQQYRLIDDQRGIITSCINLARTLRAASSCATSTISGSKNWASSIATTVVSFSIR